MTGDLGTAGAPPVADEPGGLRRAGAKGALWQGVAFACSKFGVMISTIVLARILVPEQFGLVALAVVLVGYAQTVADAGVGQALVYLPRTARTLNAAVLCAAAVGTLLMVACLLGASAVGAFFGQPDVAPLVRLSSVALLAASLGSVPESLLRRALRFHRITVARAISAVVTASVAVTSAVLGAGAWSIVWGNVAGAVVFAVAAWVAVPERVPFTVWRTTRADLRTVLRFGVPVAGATLLARAVFDVDYLIVGKLLGPEGLAYYTLAFKLPELIILNVFYVITSVTFPLYTRTQADPPRLRRGYVFSFGLQSLYGVTAGVGLAAVAPLVIGVVFGDRWAAATVPLVALALYSAVRTVGGGANEIYKARGKPWYSIVISLVRLVVLVPALILATRWGISGVAWTQCVLAVLFALLMQGVAVRVIGLAPARLLRALVPALTAGGAAGIVAWGAVQLPLPSGLALAIAVLAGGASAALALLLLHRRFVLEIRDLFSRRPLPA